MMQNLRATKVGTKARALFRDASRQWTVLASVRGAIYLESDQEEVLWIAAERLALHRRAVLVPKIPSRLPAPGTPCSLHDELLQIGLELVVVLSAAADWRPDSAARGTGNVVKWSGQLAEAAHRAALQSVPRGCFIRVALHALPDAGLNPQGTMGETLAATARRGITTLKEVASTSELLKGLESAVELVGLGEGLTPSGDDFLGAFLFTLRVMDCAAEDAYGIDWQSVEAWLRRVKPLTNKISYAVLADHACGEASEPLSALVHAAMSGASQARLDQLVGRLGEIGHSSGWDMLAGVYCASSASRSMVETPSDVPAGPRVHAGRDSASSQARSWKEVVRVC